MMRPIVKAVGLICILAHDYLIVKINCYSGMYEVTNIRPQHIRNLNISDINMADAVLIMQVLANQNKYGTNGTDNNHLTKSI